MFSRVSRKYLDTREMAKNKDKSENIDFNIPNGYLTLKEASERTEYTPDYIGQLIRSGKIEGKQVYSNALWVANESSLRMYLDSKGKESHFKGESLTLPQLPDFVRPLLYIVIVCSAIFLVILIHVLSVTIDRVITSSVQDNAEGISVQN